MRKKLKLSSEGNDSGSMECKRIYSGAYSGVWQSLRLAEVWSQAAGFVLVCLAGIWLSRREHAFTFNLPEKENL
jgi:hypothetical protein